MSHRGRVQLQRQRGLRIELVSRVVLLHFIRCELQRLRGVDRHVQQLQRSVHVVRRRVPQKRGNCVQRQRGLPFGVVSRRLLLRRQRRELQRLLLFSRHMHQLQRRLHADVVQHVPHQQRAVLLHQRAVLLRPVPVVVLLRIELGRELQQLRGVERNVQRLPKQLHADVVEHVPAERWSSVREFEQLPVGCVPRIVLLRIELRGELHGVLVVKRRVHQLRTGQLVVKFLDVPAERWPSVRQRQRLRVWVVPRGDVLRDE